MKKLIFTIWAVGCVFFVQAQSFSGRVLDAETKEPLVGANVELQYDSDTIFTITDVNGLFTAPSSSVEVIFHISYLGYERLDLFMIPAKDESYTFLLTVDESNIAVTPIILANPFVGKDVSFNRKEFQILPGAYEDPSRLLMKSPGFSTSNDQANYILYKGLPSQYIVWSVNDAPVVNPNHLSNAGSLSDVSSINAGGVNMISGQVIGTYNFAGAPFSYPYNDALGGFSNIRFSDFEKTYLNFSLIGLEAGYGFSNKMLPGAQINYRYSTVGLLSAMGVNFGNESIDYQDLFARIVFIEKKNRKLETFLTIGNSHNVHEAVANRQDAIIFKDLQDIDFESGILLTGLNFQEKRNRFILDAAVNYSLKNDERFASANISFATADLLFQQLVSGHLSLTREGDQSLLKWGITAKYADDFRDQRIFGISERLMDFQNLNLFPYTTYQRSWNRVFFSGGLGVNYNHLTANAFLEPTLKVMYNFSDQQNISLNYRKNSQLLSSVNFSYTTNPEEVRGKHLDLTYNYNRDRVLAFANIFYHGMNGILVEQGSNYSQFTGLDHRFLENYDYTGEGRVTGFSAGTQLRNVLLSGMQLTANLAFFDARYTNYAGEWLDNTFGFDYTWNGMITYDRPLRRSRELLISLSFHRRGPLKEFEIDEDGSAFLPLTLFDFTTTPQIRMTPYERMDFRILYNLRKSASRRFSQSISLDLLNVLNKENDGFNYYDAFQQRILLQNQLGMIPILAYRIEF